MRRAAKVDLSQAAIVEALRAVGAWVFYIKQPVDLCVKFRGAYYLLEIKTPGRKRKDQKAQDALIELLSIPIVMTPDEALKAIGATQ